MPKPTALALAANELAKGAMVRVRGVDLVAFTPSAVRTISRRIAAGEARMEILSLLATQLVMPKKNSTQAFEYLESLPVNPIDNSVSMPAEKRDWLVSVLKPVDQRHEKRQKPRKKAKKSAAKKPAKARR